MMLIVADCGGNPIPEPSPKEACVSDESTENKNVSADGNEENNNTELTKKKLGKYKVKG